MEYEEWQDAWKNKRKMTRNAVRCRACGDVIESKHRHDFQMCSCGKVFVDGGLSYCRVGGSLEDIEFLTEFEDDTKGEN